MDCFSYFRPILNTKYIKADYISKSETYSSQGQTIWFSAVIKKISISAIHFFWWAKALQKIKNPRMIVYAYYINDLESKTY